MKKQFKTLVTAVVAGAILMTYSCKKPAASFSSDKTSAKVGEAIVFTNTSTADAQAMWDFGDGTQISSTQNKISHAYKLKGTYSVSLTATKKNGKKESDAPTMEITITESKTPVADFTASKTTVAANEVVTFTSTSTEAEEFDWDFGDGEMNLSHTNPIQTHYFSAGGSYTVTLTVYSVNHTLKSSKSMTITVGGATGNNINLGLMVGVWKYQSRAVTDKRGTGGNLTNFISFNAGSCNACYQNNSQQTSATFTDNHEFTALSGSGNIIKSDVNGNYLSSGSFNILDNTRMSFSGGGSSAYGQTSPSLATYVVTATTLTITYVSTAATLPGYTDYSVGTSPSYTPHPAGEKQVVTTTYTYIK